MCPAAAKQAEVKWFGFAIDGKGFYAMDNVPPLPCAQPANLAFVLVDDPRANEQVLEEGLKLLVCEDWNWQVRRLSETDFSVVFPTPDSLKLCKNAADLALPGSRIRIIVLDSINNPLGAPPPLSAVWAKVLGVPPCLLEPERLKAALGMVGKPLAVDAASLTKEPKEVLMQFQIHTPELHKMVVPLYVNGKGYRVEIVPVGRNSAQGSVPPPPPSKPDHDSDKDDEEDPDANDQNDSDAHWKRKKSRTADPPSVLEPKDKGPVGQQSSSLHKSRPKKAGVKPSKKNTASAPVAQKNIKRVPSPSSAPAPSICQYGSNLQAGPSFAAKLAAAVSPIAISESPELSPEVDVPHFSPEKIFKLSAEDRADIGWESPTNWDFENETLAQHCKKLKVGRSFAGVAKKLDLTAEVSAGITVAKGKRSAAVAASPLLDTASPSKISKSGSAASTVTSSTPTSSARRSGRIKGKDVENMLQKAVRVQASKDPGTLAPSADFVLLSSLPDERLLAVASDSGVALLPGVGSVGDLISLVKAKELAQATLAQAQALASKRAEEESIRAAEAAANATASTSAVDVPVSSPLGCLVNSDNHSLPKGKCMPAIPKPKRVSKKVLSSPLAPRALRKTPARQARASPRVSK
jgi:hypothetical protein